MRKLLPRTDYAQHSVRTLEPRKIAGRIDGLLGRVLPTRVIGARESLRLDGGHNYQVAGIRFLASHNRAILGDDPGIGKTFQALRALDNNPGIVIGPASVEGVWKLQASRWRPDLQVAHGDGSMPRQGRLDFYSFDYRGRLPIVDAATVIIDEAHYLRHLEIVRATRWAYLNTANNLWLLTGSPVVGSKDDLENLYTFLGVRDCMLRRTVKDVDLELPQRVYDTIPVDLPHDLYHVLSILDEEWKEIPSTKLPGIDRFSEARVQLTRAKCTAMFEWVAKYAQHSRCVVYSMYLDPLKLLVASRSDWALVTGEMNVNERDAVIAAFDKGLYRGLACSLTAVGVGVSLAAAERILFVDRSWNPGENEQVERRVCRIGNTSERVYVTDLVAAHPLEERVYEVLRAKQVDIDLVDYMR